MQVNEANARPSSTPPPRPLSVLVVEDEVIVARDLQQSLDDMGYEVLAAVSSGAEALRASRERVPDVVLMDIRIAGDQDGIDTGTALQQRHQVPVIYMTAYSDAATISRAVRSSPYGYIVKPFTGREVRSAIEVACRRHEVDRRVAQRERWFSTMLFSIGDAVVACDPQQCVAFMNPAAERLTGWSLAEARGRELDEVVKILRADRPSLRRELAEVLALRRAGHVPAATSQLLARSGERLLSVQESVAAIVHEGILLGAVVVLRDVTDQREAQERAMVSDRLASLGMLAAGTAHEINNPLTFVVGNTDYLERGLSRWESLLCEHGEAETLNDIRDAVADLRQGARRIQRVVADMSLFGASSIDPPTLLDLCATVEWALRVTASQARHRAELVTELGPMPPVLGRESELGQVFVNLLVNAIQAVPEGQASEQVIRVVTGTDPRGWARVAVHNTGPSIPPDVMPRIFDPFFSTKLPGQGTGLGLTICSRIVASFGGDLTVQSSPEHGTCFELRLPGATRPQVPALPEPEGRAAHRGRVLVVDDEPGVLRMLRAMIGGEHEVVARDGARAALAELERDPRFDVILCDLMMPQVGGQELMREIERRWPQLVPAIVFMTGGAFSPAAAEFLASVENAHLQKPFEPAALFALLARKLSEQGEGRSL